MICNGRDVYLFANNNIELGAITFECGETEDYKSRMVARQWIRSTLDLRHIEKGSEKPF